MQLSGTRAPSTAAEHDCQAVFEGELHNRRELVRELACAMGDDAQVALQAYLRWGRDALARLRGVFALVIRDGRDCTVLGARDPLGIHPLFYARHEGELLLSPSLDELVAHPGVSSQLNRAALADHLAHRWPDPGETFFSAVRRIPPGSAMFATPAGTRIERYWDPAPDGEPVDWIGEEELERFDELLSRAVDRCLDAGPAGIFLSGGLDSVTVAGVAADNSRRRGMPDPLALSLVFPDAECNEENVQRGVAGGLGLPQVILGLDDTVREQGLLATGLELSASWPAPVVSWWLPAYRRLADEGVLRGCKTILTGGGGDEWLTVSPLLAADLLVSLRLVALYRMGLSHQRSWKRSPLALARNLLWTFGAQPLLRGVAGRIARLAVPGALEARHRRVIAASVPDWVAPDAALRREMVERSFDRWPRPTPFGSFYLHELRSSLDHALVSMEMEENFEHGRRSGLRILQPFLDADLVDFLYRTPPELLNRGGRSKGLVREALTRRFPDLGFERQKKLGATGYATSMLLDQGGRALRLMGGTPALAELGVVDGQAVHDLLHRLTSTRQVKSSRRIWDTLSLEAWVRPRL